MKVNGLPPDSPFTRKLNRHYTLLLLLFPSTVGVGISIGIVLVVV